MTVHWQTMPRQLRPPAPPKKEIPIKRDIRAINRVLKAAGSSTRADIYNADGEKLVHWLGTPRAGQIIVYVLMRPPGEKISKIAGLLGELAEELSAARGVETVPRLLQRPLALELPHYAPAPMPWVDPVGLQPDQARLGVEFSIAGTRDAVADLGRLPHILISGRTGAGKTILLNGLLGSLCMATPPADLRLWLIDPKNRDLIALAGLPHVERATFRDEDADKILDWFADEIDRRIAAGRTMGPRHVLVIDELASFVDALPRLEGILKRAGMMGRALGVNIIAATQRTDAAAIGGQFRAQFSARISGSVATVEDARINVGVRDSGAESLPLGSGRFVMSADGRLSSFQAHLMDRPAALVRAVRSKWTGADLPAPAAVGSPYGDDEAGQVAAAVAELVPGFVAGDVSQNELLRVAFAAGALQSKSAAASPRNRGVLAEAIERIEGGV